MTDREAISIHSSHTGRDGFPHSPWALPGDFNPLFPYGKRPYLEGGGESGKYFNPLFPYGKRRRTIWTATARWRFQSTLPIREETGDRLQVQPIRAISIHSSHTGRDPAGAGAVCRGGNFNPLFPYGKRQTRIMPGWGGVYFNPLFPYGKRP